MTRLTAIVPVWNEAASVEKGVRTLGKFLEANLPDYEILLIESGSNDGTDVVCDSLVKDMAKVRVLHENSRNGFGAALELAFKNAKGKLFWIVPIDLPFPLAALSQALALIDNHDAVLSYRSDDRRPMLRRTRSYVYQALGRQLLGIRTRSINSAFKLYRRESVIGLPLRSRGWTIDAEIIYWLQRRKLLIAELPVPLLERQFGTSSIRSTDWIRILGDLLSLWWVLRK